jgi:small subunit ribosomal protein S4e
MPQDKRKHLKRLNAPSHWMLDKMGGIYAPRPTPGPHKLRECLPLILLIRNRLKYAMNIKETLTLLQNRLVEVDGKVRTDRTYPAGFMDVVVIKKSGDYFRMLFDGKGRFIVHPISKKESRFKLCKVVRTSLEKNGIPYLLTHDGRKIRYPDPEIRVNDTVKVNIDNGKITKFVKFGLGNLCYVTGGNSRGRIGEIFHHEKHLADFDIIHVRDISGEQFSTRIDNVFVIGPGHTSWITLPKGKGLRVNTVESRKLRIKATKESKKGKKTKQVINKIQKAIQTKAKGGGSSTGATAGKSGKKQ